MIRPPLDVHGRTPEEAIAEGLATLGLTEDQVTVEILEHGSKGFLGLGAREAVVRIVSRLAPADAVQATLAEIMAAGGLAGAVSAEWDEAAGVVSVAVDGADLGPLIGRRGRTIEALETLLNVACCRGKDGPRQVVLDVGGYRARRAEMLGRLASRMADNARRTGREMALEPMSARDRRIIHLALQNDSTVVTRSEGEEPFRRVIIAPRE